MKTFNITQHFVEAISLIRKNLVILWCLGLIAFLSSITLLLKDTPFFQPLNILTTVLSVIATPVIYGIYYQIIQESYSSVTHIARTYILPYAWLLVRMYLPVIFLAALPTILQPDVESGGYFHVTIVASSMIYLYVIPFFYFSGQQRGAISSGVRFLLRHLSSSTPLLLFVLLLETALLILQQYKGMLFEQVPLLFACIDSGLYIAASLGDFALFIILVFILKNEKAMRLGGKTNVPQARR